MATYLLVHGAWHGGWCWRRVEALLRAAGHTVFSPTLTGLGSRAHLAVPEIDLMTHVNDVIGVLDAEELEDVVLCGHSYGGMVVTHVLDRRADAFRACVWLDAFVPADSQSLLDIFAPERAQHMRQVAASTGEGWRVPPLPPEYFGVNEADADWVRRRCVDHPLHTFSQRLPLSGAWAKVPKKIYVLAEGHPNSNFGVFADRLRGDPNWEVTSVDGGHDVMVDNPEGLAEILLRLA